MTTTEALKGIIQSAFECGTLYAKSMLQPNEDKISQNEAYRCYGRAFIMKHIELGNLHFYRANNRKYLMRSEIETFIRKEQMCGLVQELNY